jgi:hypothetical protein
MRSSRKNMSVQCLAIQALGITYLHRALYYENRLWVPKDESLRQEILESEHDSKVAGHMGQDKMVELI